MKALVVFESMFGNTEAVARAVAEGLSSAMDVTLTDVALAPETVPSDVGLVLVGAPTHAFSLSKRQTRVEAHRQGAIQGEEKLGMREWLGRVAVTDSTSLAAFDTRVAKVRRLPGSAAGKAARIMRSRRLGRVVARESFYVTGTPGPLLEGESDRARRWGLALAERFSGHAMTTGG